jgi:MOSC domain-containing protein YiiM
MRAHGNEHWEFDDSGLMQRRDMSANDYPSARSERRYVNEEQTVPQAKAWLTSVNLATPRTLSWQGRLVQTGIDKRPVEGPVAVHRLGLTGDMQADLRVHGGLQKAVYVYASEHYGFWRAELPGTGLPPGSFGENLTIAGLLEADVHVGDHLQIGTAVFQVTQPRTPCFKLALKFGRPDMIHRFLASGRSGFYLSVVTEGLVKAGSSVEHAPASVGGPSILDLVRRIAQARA